MAQVDEEKEVSEERSGVETTKLLLGRVVAVFGILVSLPAVLSPNLAPIATFLAIVLGVVGYALGARRLGAAAAIVAVCALILGLLAINGYIPGINPPGVNEQTPS